MLSYPASGYAAVLLQGRSASLRLHLGRIHYLTGIVTSCIALIAQNRGQLFIIQYIGERRHDVATLQRDIDMGCDRSFHHSTALQRRRTQRSLPLPR